MVRNVAMIGLEAKTRRVRMSANRWFGLSTIDYTMQASLNVNVWRGMLKIAVSNRYFGWRGEIYSF